VFVILLVFPLIFISCSFLSVYQSTLKLINKPVVQNALAFLSYGTKPQEGGIYQRV
jgi:hypothetical protein